MKEPIDPARKLHLLQGYSICIESSCSVSSDQISPCLRGSSFRVSSLLVFCGAAGDPAAAPYPENDDFAYTSLSSPFSETPDPKRCSGLVRGTDGTLFCGEKSCFVLRDPALFDFGLRILLEIPEILARKNPVISVSCNGELLKTITVSAPGRVELVLPLRDLNRALMAYLESATRPERILLSEFDRVCKKYGISWYLICGGLVGMMRDGMLLPWDDDIDIAVTREDYERLIRAAKKEWPSGGDYLLVSPSDYGHGVFLDYMTRLLYMKEKSTADLFSRVLTPCPEEIHYHFGMDIHILENASDRLLPHVLQIGRIRLLYALSLGHRCTFDLSEHTEYSRSQRFLIGILISAGRHISLETLLKKYRAAAAKYRNQPGNCYFLSNAYYRAIPFRFRREWFGTPKEVFDGDTRLLIPQDADSYLRAMYGNYRKYPPFKDRQPTHWEGGPTRKLSEERYDKP